MCLGRFFCPFFLGGFEALKLLLLRGHNGLHSPYEEPTRLASLVLAVGTGHGEANRGEEEPGRGSPHPGQLISHSRPVAQAVNARTSFWAVRETAKIVFDPLVSTCWHRDRCVRKAKAMKLPTAPEVAAFMLIVGSFVMGKEAHSNRQTQPMSSCFESRALSLDSILQDGSPCGASYSPRVTSSVRCVGYHRSLRRSLDAVRVCSAAATKSTRPFSCTTLGVRLLASVHCSPFTGVLRMPA